MSAPQSEGPLSVLAEFPSKSNPNKTYQVMLGNDGVTYCNCPAWKFQRDRSPDGRTCKHIDAWRQS